MDNFINEAIKEAKKGSITGGLPIGAVLVKGSKIIGRGHNKLLQQNDPILHAEIDCIRDACRIDSYENTTLYTTLMPCYLCAGVVVKFGIYKVVVGDSTTRKRGSPRGVEQFLKSHGVELINLNLLECKILMETYIENNPQLWDTDTNETNKE